MMIHLFFHILGILPPIDIRLGYNPSILPWRFKMAGFYRCLTVEVVEEVDAVPSTVTDVDEEVEVTVEVVEEVTIVVVGV